MYKYDVYTTYQFSFLHTMCIVGKENQRTAILFKIDFLNKLFNLVLFVFFYRFEFFIKY